MDETLENLVWRRAGDACEYCRMPSACDPAPFQIDHVIARKHGGQTTAENLALSCFRCNAYKGPNIAGIDPVTQEIVPLFHPRKDRWEEHFAWDGAVLAGRSPAGRATIAVLEMNDAVRVTFRETLIDEGRFVPSV